MPCAPLFGRIGAHFDVNKDEGRYDGQVPGISQHQGDRSAGGAVQLVQDQSARRTGAGVASEESRRTAATAAGKPRAQAAPHRLRPLLRTHPQRLCRGQPGAAGGLAPPAWPVGADRRHRHLPGGHPARHRLRRSHRHGADVAGFPGVIGIQTLGGALSTGTHGQGCTSPPCAMRWRP